MYEKQDKSYVACGYIRKDRMKTEVRGIFIPQPVIFIPYSPDFYKDNDNDKIGYKSKKERLDTPLRLTKYCIFICTTMVAIAK